MSTRKITIKLDTQDVLNVLKDLKFVKEKEDGICLTLDLPDKKEVYKYLSSSDYIMDWNFGEFLDGDEELEAEVVENHPATSIKKRAEMELDREITEETTDKFTKFILDFAKRSEKVYDNLGIFIEATWKLCKKSPGIVFGTPLFKSGVEEILDKATDTPTIERVMLEKVIESYYVGFSLLDVVLDLKDKIFNKWKSLQTAESLTSASIMLFRNA